MDDDCDGSAAVRRDYVTSFEGLVDFTVVNATASGGRAVIQSGGSIELADPLGFESGVLVVGIVVDELPAMTWCDLLVVTDATPPASQSLVLGLQQVAFTAVPPGATITRLRVSCSGFGPAKLDWLTVQNGAYDWPPLNDVQISYSTMAFPAAGRTSFLRLSEGYDGTDGILMTGGDVGGFAWSEAHDPDGDALDPEAGRDPTVWRTANGRADEWDTPDELGVWDAYAEDRGDEDLNGSIDPEEFDVYVLTGDEDSGGLFKTSNVVQDDWTRIPATLGANKHVGECHGSKSLSSGRMLVEHPGEADWLLVGSTVAATRGVWFYDTVSGTTVERFTGLPLPPQTPVYRAQPTALAAHLAPDEANLDVPIDVVLVGYRTLASSDTAHDGNALYACFAGFDPSIGTGACTPVVDLAHPDRVVLDVRDIEVVPDVDGRFLVADGGGAWNGASCVYGESTVWTVDVRRNVLGDLEFDVWDTDADPVLTDGPSWTGGQPYYMATSGYNCNLLNGVQTSGDLLAPEDSVGKEAHEISTLSVDPSGDFAFVFFPAGESNSQYGCVRTFRAPLASLVYDANLAWEPYQDYSDGDMYTLTSLHAQARRDNLTSTNAMRGSWMEDEPLPEIFAGSYIHDAVFVPRATGAPDLLATGSFPWWVFRDADGPATWDASTCSTGANTCHDVGWDSPPHVTSPSLLCMGNDLDCADWALAWGGDSSMPVFQNASAISASVRPAHTEFPIDTVIGGGSKDFRMALLYGGSSTSREPADHPCEMTVVTGLGLHTSTWVPDSGINAQAWLTIGPQGSVYDSGLHRGIFYSDESMGDLGQEWCWDAMVKSDNTSNFAGYNFFNDLSGSWGLTCQDRDFTSHKWMACDEIGLTPWNMTDAGVGHPLGITAIDDDTALLVTALSCMTESTETTPCTPVSGTEGVWIVEYTGTAGLDYTKIPFNSITPGDTCTSALMFEYGGTYDTNSAPRLSWDETSDALGLMRFYVTSRDPLCGLYLVEVDRANPAGAAWEKLLPSAASAGCTLDETALEGATVSHDGEWVLAFGSDYDDFAPDEGGVCAIDLVTMTGQQVVSGTVGHGAIQTLVAHPHVDDLYYFGLWNPEEACTTCSTPTSRPGVYALQRRYRPPTDDWGWGWKRVSGGDLEMRKPIDLDFGPGTLADAPSIKHVYVTTASGAWWDGTVSW